MTAAASRELIRAVQVVIGVDTHQDQHVAIAIDQQGVRLAEHHAPATSSGYGELERWSQNLGEVRAFGVEGTGSYDAGLTRFLTGRGFTVFEVNRPDRSVRYRKGKSDPTDAEMAARAVIAGVADATPKSGEGEVEMLRMLKSAKDSAVKARTQAVNQMRALVVTAPAALRETLDGLTATALAARCKSFRPGRLENPMAAAKYTLRSLACRYLQLSKEIHELQVQLERLAGMANPALVSIFGVGLDTAATLLISAGSNPQRLRSEAAFASLCGVNPIPASSGKTNRHRLNRGGDRQANAALHRIVLVSPNPPKDTDGRREDSGRGVRELQGRWPGLHWGRWEVGGRSSVAAQGPYGRLRELRCAGWRENTQQGTLADRGGASLRGRWVSCSLAVRPGVEWLAAGPRRE